MKHSIFYWCKWQEDSIRVHYAYVFFFPSVMCHYLKRIGFFICTKICAPVVGHQWYNVNITL